MNANLTRIAKRIDEFGGTAFLIGGAVRDQFFGHENKDLDVEVFGLDVQTLFKVLSEFGRVDEVGRSFGVFKLRVGDDDFDFSVPRTESLEGFDWKFEFSNLTPRQAARRRDFSWNALMQNVLTGKIFDFFRGRRDVRRKVLRVTNRKTFQDDPNRVLRGMQFCGRKEVKVERRSRNLMRAMTDRFDEVFAERVFVEWMKWAEKSQTPSMGLRFLVDVDWVKHFPEVDDMTRTPQSPEHHPEGTVFEHTCQAVDWAVRFKDPVVTFAALLHDCGKWDVSEFDPMTGQVWSSNHASVSGERARDFLNKMRAPKDFTRKVVCLVETHMRHVGAEPTKRAVRRLAVVLAAAGVTFEQWAQVVECDHSARVGEHDAQPQGCPVEDWVRVANELNVESQAPEKLVQGRDVMGFMQPGPQMGVALRAAFEAQLDGVFETTADGVEWVREFVKQGS